MMDYNSFMISRMEYAERVQNLHDDYVRQLDGNTRLNRALFTMGEWLEGMGSRLKNRALAVQTDYVYTDPYASKQSHQESVVNAHEFGADQAILPLSLAGRP